MSHVAPPLWQQLGAAASVIDAVLDGRSTDSALEKVPAHLRPGVQSLAYHSLRHLGFARAVLAQLAHKAPPARVRSLLCVALALAGASGQELYDLHTLVDQTVEAAKRHAASRPMAPFVNACLRRFLREQKSLVEHAAESLEGRWNHPEWWIRRLQADHPDTWQDILAANNAQAPMTLRVNARQATPQAYLQELVAVGIAGRVSGPSAITLKTAVPVQKLPGFLQGRVSVQDAAAQLAAPLVLNGLQPGQGFRCLDACAAPGGKTGHLLELQDMDVMALDIDPVRCERIAQNLARLNLKATVLTADAAQPGLWWDGRLFDAILLDAPCTASGIVRRHPDVRWLRRASDVDQLAAIQARMLQALWPLLKPGGRLVYCTCSVFRAEGDDGIQTFVTNNRDAVLRPSPGHLRPQNGANTPSVPDNGGIDHDGFYYALLEKRAA